MWRARVVVEPTRGFTHPTGLAHLVRPHRPASSRVVSLDVGLDLDATVVGFGDRREVEADAIHRAMSSIQTQLAPECPLYKLPRTRPTELVVIVVSMVELELGAVDLGHVEVGPVETTDDEEEE